MELEKEDFEEFLKAEEANWRVHKMNLLRNENVIEWTKKQIKKHTISASPGKV